jgi:hypothetical protein
MGSSSLSEYADHPSYLPDSSSLAHAFQSRQLASNSAFAASGVSTRLSVRKFSGLLGKCSAQNQRRCLGVAIAMAQSAPTPIPSNRGDGRGGKAALSDLYSGALSRAFEIPPCADAPRSGGPC